MINYNYKFTKRILIDSAGIQMWEVVPVFSGKKSHDGHVAAEVCVGVWLD